MFEFVSEIRGKALVVFGGKIGIAIGRVRGVKIPHVILDLAQTKEGVIGKYRKTSLDEWVKESPVQLVFDKVESIDAVMAMLQQAKERLKMEIDTYEEGE